MRNKRCAKEKQVKFNQSYRPEARSSFIRIKSLYSFHHRALAALEKQSKAKKKTKYARGDC
jgi:hypothetical protein